jgi:hypothetical protein
MHYIVGPAINALVILIAVAAGEDRLRNPLFSGALTAILCINYDWYVFAAALAVYVLVVIRLRNVRTIAVYLAVAIVPPFAWKQFLDVMTDGSTSTAINHAFISAVLGEWLEFFAIPGARPLLPLAVSQLGFDVAVHEVIALIHWPLLVCCAVVLWRSRPAVDHGRKLLLLLVLVFAVEQLFTAAFDWENNPRRALPVFVAFACAYCWSIDATRDDKRWRIGFGALFVFTALVAFADVLIRTPAAAILYLGEIIRGPAKRVLQWQTGTIQVAELEPAYRVFREFFGPMPLSAATASWAIANLFAAFSLIALFALLARVELLPRKAPYVCAAVIAASAIRFVL